MVPTFAEAHSQLSKFLGYEHSLQEVWCICLCYLLLQQPPGTLSGAGSTTAGIDGVAAVTGPEDESIGPWKQAAALNFSMHSYFPPELSLHMQ